MSELVLEQLVSEEPNVSFRSMHQTVDTYDVGTQVLYSSGPSKGLTIRDMPSVGLQLHIHEGVGGSANLKTYGGQHVGINSYDAAMMDYKMDQLGYNKLRR